MHAFARAAAALAVLAALAGAGRADKPQTASGPGGTVPVSHLLKTHTTALSPGEIDRLIAREQQTAGVKALPLTSDEQFIRRIHLDLTGKLPQPVDILAFMSDKSPGKRGKL